MPELFKYVYRVLPFNLVAGLTNFEVPVDAEKIVYAAPTDGPEITIRLQLQSNDAIPLRPQGEIVAPFQRLYITAPAVAKTVYLLVGSPKDIQLTGRDISISGLISGRTIYEHAANLGQLYRGFISQTPVAGQISGGQLLNPTGSGKTVVLLKWSISNSNAAALQYRIGRLDAAQTFVRNLSNNQVALPDSTAQLLNHVSVGGLIVIPRHNIFVPTLSTSNEIPDYVVLAPGQGIDWECSTVLNAILVNVHIWEF